MVDVVGTGAREEHMRLAWSKHDKGDGGGGSVPNVIILKNREKGTGRKSVQYTKVICYQKSANQRKGLAELAF